MHVRDRSLGEECGVFGIITAGRDTAAADAYLGLFALQHRGQEAAGIAVSDGKSLTVVKDVGLVTQVFTERTLVPLKGNIALGHVRYSTTGSDSWHNAQPVFRPAGRIGFAIGHNGNLTNTMELAAELAMLPGMLDEGCTADTDIIGELVARAWPAEPRADGRELEHALAAVLPRLEGAFSLVLMDDSRVIAVRDRHGFRPLVLGRLDDGWVVASETAALDIVGAHKVRDVAPGEMIVIDQAGRREVQWAEPNPKLCLFEFVYFARPDSELYGRNVHAARVRMGEQLASQAPVVADLVVPVPESGIPAAQGFARVSGIPYGDGLVKNRYVGRTFIQPDQRARGLGVRLKLNPLVEAIRGRRLVVVDDSIVRGTTTRQLVAMLREAGAAEVHLRISSPPYRWPCFYGMDTGNRSELLAADLSVGEIRDYVGADSLGYLDLDRLVEATGAPAESFCNACLTGDYPVAVPVGLSKNALEVAVDHAARTTS